MFLPQSLVFRPGEREDGDLRLDAYTNRGAYATDACIYIEVLWEDGAVALHQLKILGRNGCCLLVETHEFGVLPFRGAPAANDELHGVGVARQCEVNVGAFQHLATPMGWVVTEKYRKSANIGLDASDIIVSFVEVSVGAEWWFADILDSNERNALFCGIAAWTNEGLRFVEQHVPTRLLLQQNETINILLASLVIEGADIFGIVVIA